MVSVAGDSGVAIGDRGTLTIDEDSVRVAFDWGEEILVDPRLVQLRRVLVA